MLCRKGLHYLMAPGDYVSGECRECFNERQHRYDVRRKAAMALMRDIEKRAQLIESY